MGNNIKMMEITFKTNSQPTIESYNVVLDENQKSIILHVPQMYSFDNKQIDTLLNKISSKARDEVIKALNHCNTNDRTIEIKFLNDEEYNIKHDIQKRQEKIMEILKEFPIEELTEFHKLWKSTTYGKK